MSYLEKKVPEENKYRFYSIQITPTLFGTWTLIRQWGRIGSTGTKKEEWFETEESAALAGKNILNRKQKKGYK